MPLTHSLNRARALFGRLPTARAYYRQHGLRLTLLRVVDVAVRGTEQRSLEAVNRWLDNTAGGMAAGALSARALGNPCVAIIGALDLPQCKKYRILQKIEQLELHGCRTSVSNYFDVPRSFDVLQLATAVIFYRVPDGELFRSYVQEARRLGLPIAYDIDDPVFCRTIYSTNANLRTLTRAEREHLIGDSRRYLAAMQQCDASIVSTPGLVDVAAQYLDGRPVYLWRNAIDAESRAICVDVAAQAPAARGETVRIGYMSGSRAHDLDFQRIAGALAAILQRYPHVELVVAGHAALPEPLKAFEPRISTWPFSSYRGYFQAIAEVDIVVIPLLADTFNACKSGIRFLEAALLEKPCVISMVGDFLNVADHGRTAYLADTEADWIAHLSDLVESGELRTRIGRQAREDVLARQSTEAIGSTLAAPLLHMIKGEVRV